MYAQYYYLQSLCNQWFGLIINDYEAVMPICTKKKWGIKYAFIPPFIQQLGLVGSKHVISNYSLLQAIKKLINKEIVYGDIHLNHLNNLFEVEKITKTNFILPLNDSYNNLYQNFSSDAKRNIEKAKKLETNYSKNLSFSTAIELYKDFLQQKTSVIPASYFDKLAVLCNYFKQNDQCFTRSIISDNSILAVGVFFRDKYRIYNIANTTTTFGRKNGANYLLLNNIIEEFSDTSLIFDFEGSDLSGVKTFYKNFSPISQPYFHWHINNLPWWVRWLKK